MNKKKFNCFVSGGAGLIGLEICNKLIAKGHNVSLYDLGEQIERNKSYINSKIKIFLWLYIGFTFIEKSYSKM